MACGSWGGLVEQEQPLAGQGKAVGAGHSSQEAPARLRGGTLGHSFTGGGTEASRLAKAHEEHLVLHHCRLPIT